MMSNKPFFLSLLGMLATLLIVGFLAVAPEPVVVKTNLENLPMKIGAYQGREASFPEEVYRELNADKNVYRHYRSGDGSEIDLYIGYYGTAKGGRTGHNPYACLPGSGWAIVDTQKARIRGPAPSSEVEVNYVRAWKDDVNVVMIHWYQTAGTTVVSTGFQQNIERFWGRLFRNRNDGATVQISAQASDEQVAEAGKKVKEFAAQVLRLLPGYWPVEE
jgi:EpsI family protein